MEHQVPQFLGLLVLILGTAKVLGTAAKWIGQPAVLGELVAGVLLGSSAFGWVDPNQETLHLLAEIGVIFLLFEIGLETDLKKLLQVGGTATVVAIVGVVLPFALGYAACRFRGLEPLVATVVGATLTATSVGITARVLADLGRLQERESQIILGAAVLDDVVGLIILAVVSKLSAGGTVSALDVAWIAAVAFGFLIVTLLVGSWLVPLVVRWLVRPGDSALATALAVMLAFALAWLAHTCGSAMILGAFVAGLLLRKTSLLHEIERGIAPLGHFFVPIFFVTIGAAVDLRTFNPMVAENQRSLWAGGLLIVAAVVGKFLAGYAPFWIREKKSVIGVGMIPRGEVGLIFAQMGLASKVFEPWLFSAVTLMVMVTTFITPPLLRMLFPSSPGTLPTKPEGEEELVNEP